MDAKGEKALREELKVHRDREQYWKNMWEGADKALGYFRLKVVEVADDPDTDPVTADLLREINGDPKSNYDDGVAEVQIWVADHKRQVRERRAREAKK